LVSGSGRLRAAVLCVRDIRDLVAVHGASGYGGLRRHQRLDHMPRPAPTHFGDRKQTGVGLFQQSDTRLVNSYCHLYRPRYLFTIATNPNG
jgi:hypothetical protein